MKTFNILVLFYIFASVTLAVPVRKGKEREVNPPSDSSRPSSPDNSRPSTPQPNPPLDHPPLPGRSGHHTVNGLTTIHYGDDDLPGHMRHVQRNQALHPENANPMELAHHSDTNRKDALHGIPTKNGKVRDEKNPNMFHNPNHHKTTTVEYRDPHESSKEGALLSGAKSAIEAGGKGAKGQLRANPGWLPLDPSQRRGHEAPARLNSQTHNGQEPQKAKKQHKPKAEKQEHKPEGYTPVTKGGMSLRHRPGQDPPLPPKTPHKKPVGAGTNLQKGTPPKPPGHVFKGTDQERPQRASHHGAPALPSNSHERHPPRPQNQAHHERMQEEARKKAAHGGSSRTHHDVTGPARDGRSHSNLQRFNQMMGPPRAGNGHGHSVEAPARLGSHHNGQPSTSHNHGASTSRNHGASTSHNHGASTSHNHGASTSHNHGASTSHNPGPSTSHNTPARRVGGTQHPPAAPRRNLVHRPASPQSPSPKVKKETKK